MVEHGDETWASSTQVDHATECIKAVEDYRGQQISKWNTIMQVSATTYLICHYKHE